jgi:ribonuclease HII
MGGRTRQRTTRATDPFRFDQHLLASQCPRGREGDLRLAGVDEAGRGCLAGPLVAAAIVLDYAAAPFKELEGLTDSKLLSFEAREALYQGVLRSAARVLWVAYSPMTIDAVGLHRCNLAALGRALDVLGEEYAIAVIDGFDLGRPEPHVSSVIGADYKSAAVAAASVVAKVVRDRLMKTLAQLHPEYGFERHVGYATAKHKEALVRYGPCVIHRLSFQGVAAPQLELWAE